MLSRSFITGIAVVTLGVAASAEAGEFIGPPAAPAEARPVAGETRPLAERWSRGRTACSHLQLPVLFEEALSAHCEAAPDPAACRADIIDRLIRSPMCYTASTREEYAEIIRQTGLLPASLLGKDPDERFGSTSRVFVGEGNVVLAPGRAQPAHLTFSFPADGVIWTTGGQSGPNDLSARLSQFFFGAADLDRAHELIRQVFANYQRSSGLRYRQVADDNAPFSFGVGRVPARGDIRLGSIPLGQNGFLAFNQFPDSGSDMIINSSFLGSMADTGNAYRYFRNTISHEHGHGLAFFHVVPCNLRKIMEPFIIFSNVDMAQVDDIRGAQSNYGDRFAGNNSASNATDFGNLTSPAPRSVIERDLSTNGVDGFDNSDEDWFRFTLDTAQQFAISVDPTGGLYDAVVNFNNADCSGFGPEVDADRAGDLTLELRSADGTTVLQTSASGGPGDSELVFLASAAAGTYTVRVYDIGPNEPDNLRVQLYDLTVRVGTSKAPPFAIAGVNKRIGMGFPCWFRGNLNSRPTEPSSAIVSYQWDFDNNGTFDASGAEASTVYPNPGVRTVRLRVTDSNGMTDDDTILVDVFDTTPPPPPTSPNLIYPPDGAVITESNPTFDWSDSTGADSYTFVVDDDPAFGSPVFTVQAFQSQIFTTQGIFADNIIYHWKITAVNGFGSTPSTPLSSSFRVNSTPPPPCPGDFDGDSQRNTVDLVIFLSFFGTTQPPNTNGDLDGNGLVNTVDLVTFLSVFGVPCP
ncbi:MAG: PKD domain-containing protein [Phycisphaerales bacterium]